MSMFVILPGAPRPICPLSKTTTDFQWLEKGIDRSRLKEDEMVKRRQKRKYEILQEEKNKTEERVKKERER